MTSFVGSRNFSLFWVVEPDDRSLHLPLVVGPEGRSGPQTLVAVVVPQGRRGPRILVVVAVPQGRMDSIRRALVESAGSRNIQSHSGAAPKFVRPMPEKIAR